MRFRMMLGCAALVACGEPEGVDTAPPRHTDEPVGACGEISEHVVRVSGVVHQDGVPIQGAEVRLEERLWHPGVKVFGRDGTGTDGTFAFDAVGVVSVEKCWGTALDYVVVAVRGDETAEDNVNPNLYNAIFQGDLTVDLSAIPLELN